jgi:hypothetical protein
MSLNREVEFSMGCDGEEDEQEKSLLINVRFVEYWFRERHPTKKNLPLKEKIVALGNELPAGAIARFTDKLEDLAMRVVVTRNFLTHLDPRLESRAAHGDQLRIINLKLGTLLWYHVGLVEFGADAVIDAIKHPPRAKQIREDLSTSDVLR